MRKPSSLMISIATAAVIGAGVLAGCGSGQPSASPTPSPAANSVATTSSSSAPATSQATTQQPANDQPGPVDSQEFARRIADGLKDIKTYTIDGEATTNADGQTMTSHMTMSFDISDRENVRMHQVIDSPLGSSEMIMIGSTTYARSTGQSMWTRMTDVPTDATASAGDLGDIQSALESTTVEFVGSETVNGSSARHYTVTAADGAVTNYYLDSKNRPVLATIDSDDVSVRLNFGKINEPVNIQAPPDSEVAA